MRSSIQTNDIDVKIDHEAFDKEYDIFAIRHDVNDNKFSFWRTKMLDAPLVDKRVVSVLCKPARDGIPSCVYVLMKKKFDNRDILRKTIKDDPDSDRITISTVCAGELMPCDLVQLCFNGITFGNDPELSASNLTGSLYLFSPAHIEMNKEANTVSQVHALSLKVSKGLLLYMNVVTFTNINEKIGSYDSKALYKLCSDPVFSMQRVYEIEDREKLFVIKQFKDKKYNVPFLDITNLHSFNASKMGILHKALTLFEQVFGGFIKLSFLRHEYDFIDHTCRESRLMGEYIRNFISKNLVSFYNKDGGEKGDEIIDKLRGCFEAYGAETQIANELSKQALNIVVIHDPDYYKDAGLPDAYKAYSPKEYIVQHITVEDMEGQRLNVKIKEKKGKPEIKQPPIAKNIFNELSVKDDLSIGKIRIFDWSAIGENMSFYYSYGEDNEKTVVMDVKKDGSFHIYYNNRQLTMFDEVERDDEKEPKLVVKTSTGKEFIIIDTRWYMMPSFSDIHQRLKENDTKLKNKEARDELMPSSLDIKCFQINDSEFAYSVGAIGAGLDTKWLHRAPNIRIVKASEPGNYPYFVKKVLPLMNAMFVRNGQLTVMPFPYKYLREWLKAQGE